MGEMPLKEYLGEKQKYRELFPTHPEAIASMIPKPDKDSPKKPTD